MMSAQIARNISSFLGHCLRGLIRIYYFVKVKSKAPEHQCPRRIDFCSIIEITGGAAVTGLVADAPGHYFFHSSRLTPLVPDHQWEVRIVSEKLCEGCLGLSYAFMGENSLNLDFHNL